MQFSKVLFIASVAFHSVFAAPYSSSSSALSRRGIADDVSEKIDLVAILDKLVDIEGTLKDLVTQETGTVDTDTNIEDTLDGVNSIVGTLGTYLDKVNDIAGTVTSAKSG